MNENRYKINKKTQIVWVDLGSTRPGHNIEIWVEHTIPLLTSSVSIFSLQKQTRYVRHMRVVYMTCRLYKKACNKGLKPLLKTYLSNAGALYLQRPPTYSYPFCTDMKLFQNLLEKRWETLYVACKGNVCNLLSLLKEMEAGNG